MPPIQATGTSRKYNIRKCNYKKNAGISKNISIFLKFSPKIKSKTFLKHFKALCDIYENYEYICRIAKLNEILLTVEKPARYVGGEYNTPDMKKPFEANLLLCFPDVYEIGMSNLGLSILYQLINSKPDFMAERCYAPWPDFGKKLKENDIPLFSLENRKKFTDFDMVGF